MRLKRTILLMLGLVFALPGLTGVAAADSASETMIKLSNSGVTVNSQTASTDSSSAVYTGADIVYYEEGHDSSYGEGSADDAHSAAEAASNTVVTITQPGTYRVSGTLSAGQLAIDLGDDAKSDPTAKVTLILDGVNITNTVAPGVIFYNVYEPYSAEEDTNGVVDLAAAGAKVIVADNSVNTVSGSYVAKIYKPDTTKKLHKYDGAFYSKMSMVITGENLGNGELHIQAEREGIGSELHLAIDGGRIYVESQDDGINTNEDGISVASINGGYLHVNAGLGAEGDGIDSNGYLVINGGTVVAMSNDRSPDGGIDADKDIIINGGTVIGLGTRNDATGSDSKQPYIELSFASTQAAGSVISLKDSTGKELLNHTAEKAFQSITFSSSDLALNTKYSLYINGTQQQYTGNAFGMMGGFPGGTMPEGGMPTGTPPEGLPEGNPPSGNLTAPPEGFGGVRPELPAGTTGQGPAATGTTTDAAQEGSTSFVITNDVHSFSGISDSADATGKKRVTFTVNNGNGLNNATSGEAVKLEQVSASADVPESDIQLTVTDIPSENYSETRLLSEIKDNLSQIMPADDGLYRLTIAVVSSNSSYTGVSEWQFSIGQLPFTDLKASDSSYSAVKALYDKGILTGTSSTTFSPNATITRATAITTLGRLLEVDKAESNSFTDIAKNSWYSGYVGWATKNGLVQGDGNGHFLPNNPLTVAEMKLILSRYTKLTGSEVQINDWPANEKQALTRANLAVILSKLL